MSAEDRACDRCGCRARVAERDGDDLTALCLACGERQTLERRRYAGYAAELDAVRGHQQPGPKVKSAAGAG